MTPERAYRVLRLRPGGTAAEDVLKAYRTLALECHPDRARSPDQVEPLTRRFLEVRDAYECLKRSGFPIPMPQEVVPDPPQVRTYERRWGRRDDEPDLPVPLREKLGFGPGPSVEQLVFWGVMLPAAVAGMLLSLRWLVGVLRGDAPQP